MSWFKWFKKILGWGEYEYREISGEELKQAIYSQCGFFRFTPAHDSYTLIPSTLWVKARCTPVPQYTPGKDECLKRAREVEKQFEGYAVGVVVIETKFVGSEHAINIMMLEGGRIVFWDIFEYKFTAPEMHKVLWLGV